MYCFAVYIPWNGTFIMATRLLRQVNRHTHTQDSTRSGGMTSQPCVIAYAPSG